jgi:hypothetical protein
MNAAGLAAVLQVIGELRAAIDIYPPPKERHRIIQARKRVEELWTDVARLLDEQHQEEVRRYDGWLKRIEDEFEAGGNVKNLVELGLKVAQQRAAVVRLDVRTVIPPSPDISVITDLVDAKLQSEQDLADLRSGKDPARRDSPKY